MYVYIYMFNSNSLSAIYSIVNWTHLNKNSVLKMQTVLSKNVFEKNIYVWVPLK